MQLPRTCPSLFTPTPVVLQCHGWDATPPHANAIEGGNRTHQDCGVSARRHATLGVRADCDRDGARQVAVGVEGVHLCGGGGG